MPYTPNRGDIIYVDSDMFVSGKTTHKRLVIVLSPFEFNKKFSLALVAPISPNVKGHGFEVMINTESTKGVVLCQQIKTIKISSDLQLIEQVPSTVVLESIAKSRVLLE